MYRNLNRYIYRYQDVNNQDLYIGLTTGKLRKRILQHDAMRLDTEKNYIPLTKWILFQNLEDTYDNQMYLEDFEQTLIHQKNPKYNIKKYTPATLRFVDDSKWEKIIIIKGNAVNKYKLPDGGVIFRGQYKED